MSDSHQNGVKEKPLYEPSILHDIDFEGNHCSTYNPEISHTNPGEGLLMRPLCREDYDNGYIQLLSQLTTVGDISREEFDARYRSMDDCLDSYYITVIEDTSTGQVIASGTLVKEQKFIHKCSARGRIEDIVVDDKYRGRQLGKLILDVLTILSKKVGCYKVSLECLDKLVPFYSQFGYKTEDKQNYMCRRYND
ncbi:glucosamine 6-phosphate N-acetyltransferase-like isoform X1 [Mizuhopecten yessoensis]|uniref:Glucosamine 6-phosphate N-acetyltransferase n=1 Tax=Mizuhopecten yessoensis TaxID=6573 RepID=A0A210PM81_MIZYE|nr:glucosamine 6-phosphate N-acetyltransferase-like isoform X1 [Mizuhopecten yessoensis]OWF37585.1 Glucosamine 6-phosphate N-acetyltransferase [Mizuhopecten yessoensis]